MLFLSGIAYRFFVHRGGAAPVSAAVNALIFKTFIAKLLVPKLRRGQFVIFDNASCHKSQEVVDIVEKS